MIRQSQSSGPVFGLRSASLPIFPPLFFIVCLLVLLEKPVRTLQQPPPDDPPPAIPPIQRPIRTSVRYETASEEEVTESESDYEEVPFNNKKYDAFYNKMYRHARFRKFCRCNHRPCGGFTRFGGGFGGGLWFARFSEQTFVLPRVPGFVELIDMLSGVKGGLTKMVTQDRLQSKTTITDHLEESQFDGRAGLTSAILKPQDGYFGLRFLTTIKMTI